MLHSIRVWTAWSAVAMLLALGLGTLSHALPAVAAPTVTAADAADSGDVVLLTSCAAPRGEVAVSAPIGAAHLASDTPDADAIRASGTAADDRSPDGYRHPLAVHDTSTSSDDGGPGQPARLVGASLPPHSADAPPLGRRAPPRR